MENPLERLEKKDLHLDMIIMEEFPEEALTIARIQESAFQIEEAPRALCLEAVR